MKEPSISCQPFPPNQQASNQQALQIRPKSQVHHRVHLSILRARGIVSYCRDENDDGMVFRGGMREASCLDTDTGLTPMSSLRVVSVGKDLFSFARMYDTGAGGGRMLGRGHTGWCYQFSIGSIEELVCFASELSQAFASCGRSCGSVFVRSHQPLLRSRCPLPRSFSFNAIPSTISSFPQRLPKPSLNLTSTIKKLNTYRHRDVCRGVELFGVDVLASG
jgi:hypothetical protein